jgi:hypothetical protein
VYRNVGANDERFVGGAATLHALLTGDSIEEARGREVIQMHLSSTKTTQAPRITIMPKMGISEGMVQATSA